MAVCLVTGGAGFIGSHLVDALVARRHAVRVLDDFSTGKRANLEIVLDKIELIAGDVADPQTVRTAMRGVDWVFHLASATALSDTLTIHNTGATGTLHLLEAARDAQVQRVVHSSTASVYRDEDAMPRCESDATVPASLFGTAQLAAEHYCLAFSRTYGLETVRLRYFEVFGPRQRVDGAHGSIVARFLQDMQRGRGPVIAGAGLQTRDFTNVEDVVQANLLAVEAPRVSGKLFNIASGQATSLFDLVSLLNQALGTQLAPVYHSGRPSELQHSRANIVRAQTELGFCPCTDLQTDVRRCLVESGERTAARMPPEPASDPVRAGVTCYRLDGPALPTNPPNRKRDWTSRIP